MNHLRRGTLVILIVAVLAAALVWYYFTKVYEGNPSIRGTLVEKQEENSAGSMWGSMVEKSATCVADMASKMLAHCDCEKAVL